MSMKNISMALVIALLLPACGTSPQQQDGGADGADGGADAADGLGGSDAADGDVLDKCSAGIQPPGGWEFLVVQEFQSADGELRLRIVLTSAGDCRVVGETIPYGLLRFALVSPQESFCVDQKSSLDYHCGHHNWDETARARHGGVEYVLRMFLDALGPGGFDDSLEARTHPDGVVLWGPLKLVDAGCRTLPPGNLNACLWRDRSDL